jgi:diguanylate cyclase (GGDEF)-like protein
LAAATTTVPAAFDKTVVVIDPSKSSRDKASAVLAALGYSPSVAADAFEALPLVDGATAVVAVHPTAEPIYPRLRAANIPLVVSLSAKQPRPATLAAHLGADSFMLRPYRKEMLAVALYSAATAQLLREQRQRLELALAELSGVRRDRHGSGLLHIDLFKKLLPLEIRRAGRHGYPIALLVVALDRLPHGRPSAELLEELALACEPLIRSAVRDVDLAVRYGEGRFLVLLPHTDARGAETVARRIVEQIRSCRFRAGGVTLMPTASVGVATQRPRRGDGAPPSTGRSGGSAHQQPSFARMVRDAHAAVRAAQLKGGDRFILRG